MTLLTQTESADGDFSDVSLSDDVGGEVVSTPLPLSYVKLVKALKLEFFLIWATFFVYVSPSSLPVLHLPTPQNVHSTVEN